MKANANQAMRALSILIGVVALLIAHYAGRPPILIMALLQVQLVSVVFFVTSPRS